MTRLKEQVQCALVVPRRARGGVELKVAILSRIGAHGFPALFQTGACAAPLSAFSKRRGTSEERVSQRIRGRQALTRVQRQQVTQQARCMCAVFGRGVGSRHMWLQGTARGPLRKGIAIVGVATDSRPRGLGRRAHQAKGAVQLVELAVTGEQNSSCGRRHFREDAPGSKDVYASPIVAATEHDLRRAVPERDNIVWRQRAGPARAIIKERCGQVAGYIEANEHQPPRMCIHYEVPRLDVAVHEASRVQVLQGKQHLLCVWQYHVRTHVALVHFVLQGLALVRIDAKIMSTAGDLLSSGSIFGNVHELCDVTVRRALQRAQSGDVPQVAYINALIVTLT